ncbi:MAG TPA: S4 domain-containing protein [Pyrinomonadaceae bacterium]|nr:S4 domain-containing protein [Pyrinomonadaceae bacterium]
MRLDLFLKASRLCPRRSVAQQLCDAGLVLLNGTPVKSAHVVRVDDQLTIRKRDKELVVRVSSVPAARQTSRKGAATLYELLSETPTNTDS